MDSTIDEDRGPDHVLHVEVKSSNQAYKDVLCQIYLPIRLDTDQVKVRLLPNEIDFSTLGRQREVSIQGGDEFTKVTSDRMICGPSTQTCLGNGNFRSEIVAQPINGLLIQSESKPDNLHISADGVTFWITRNSFATPATKLTSSDTSIAFENTEEMEFCAFGQRYSFFFQMGYDVRENGDISSWPILVAKTDMDTKEKVNMDDSALNEKLYCLDDLLVLLSFGSQKRTRCIGWEINDGKHSTTYYRGDFFLPSKAETGTINFHDALVPESEIQDYLHLSSMRFESYENKIALRNALNISLHNEGSIEQRFLSNFSALESLVHGFRRRNELAGILCENRWGKLQKEIKKLIKNSKDPILETEERKRIYAKMGELNRVSLRDAYTGFCSDLSLPTEDLWPVFGGNGESGLSDIRNALIHGAEYPTHIDEAIARAGFQLDILLKRSLLLVLGIDLSICKVHEAELKFLYGAEGLRYSQDSETLYSFLNN